jgi:hypothetical protein
MQGSDMTIIGNYESQNRDFFHHAKSVEGAIWVVIAQADTKRLFCIKNC